MHLFKHFEIISDLVAANVKRLDLVVGLQAHHELVEALGCNQIGMNIKSLKLHFLLLEGTD